MCLIIGFLALMYKNLKSNICLIKDKKYNEKYFGSVIF